jgi:transmembrane sensor
VEATAAEWIVRLGGKTLGLAERAKLDAWLAADPRHQAAFDYARSTWAQLDLLNAEPGLLGGETAAALATPPRLARSAPRLWGRAGALVAGGAVMLGLGAIWFGDPVTMARADHQTGVGELRSIALDDGSHIELGPDTAIVVRFTDQERRVELLSGVAAFAPRPKAEAGGRPFVVVAANGRSTALGTRFVVDKLPAAVRVAVTQHTVNVSARTAAGRTADAVLSPGYQVRYDAAGLGTMSKVIPGQAEAWRRGRLVFDGAPLGDAVAELNRYRRGRIVVADAALARRRVSGVFNTGDVNGAVVAIAAEFGADTVTVGPFLTVIR